MMNYSEILGLLEKGFTPDQIMQLQTQAPQPEPTPAPAPQPAPAPAPAPAPQPEPTPAWADALNQNILAMTRAVQAQGIAQSFKEVPSTEQIAADAMAAVIAPPVRNNKGGNK